MKSSHFLIGSIMTILTLSGCGEKDKSERARAPLETKNSLLQVESGRGDQCANIVGLFQCVPDNLNEGESPTVKVDFKPWTDDNGRQRISTVTFSSTPIYDYLAKAESELYADGAVHDFSFPDDNINGAYSIDCHENTISTHVKINDYGMRHIVTKIDDDSFRLDTRSMENNVIVYEKATCTRIKYEPQIPNDPSDSEVAEVANATSDLTAAAAEDEKDLNIFERILKWLQANKLQ